MNNQLWQSAVEQELGVQLAGWRQLGGGDFAQSWCAKAFRRSVDDRVDAGRVFVKTHANPPPHHFSTEARGLRWLKESEAINVATVLGESDDPPYLILKWITEGQRTEASEIAFGAELARLHQAPCTHFGRLDERTTGSLGLPNAPSEHWSEFFATQRLIPLAYIARERQSLSIQTIAKIERLAQRLSLFTELDVAPSRLHGDLWAGNRLVDDAGENWLIDPACHGGHRESDLAMMQLFGGFGDLSYHHYDEHYPLDDGWQERIALHQLAPLIVHAIKFGRAYVAPTEAALARYV